ncbi:FtsX-like permease family protein [Allofournierella sp.]|uniref:ABC transporter permease n=1 Tax=Allofournierella sp. TaxID=1940256 RepID=UPI003AB6BDC8
MLKVNNRKAVSRLALRSFAANRTRNLIAVGAIALTAVLFTTLFTLGLGAVDNLQKATMRQSGGDGHAVLKYLTDQQYDAVKDHRLIDRISYNRLLADSVDNPELLKRRGEFYYMDETGLDLTFCTPTTGRAPQAENEIITDTKTLQMLGVPQQIGAPLTLQLTVHGKKVTREFVLSGWWQADPVFNVAIFSTSRAYVDAHAAELANTYAADRSMTGVINSYVMFRNTFDLQGKLDTLLADSGYQSVDQNAADYMASNTNWAYLSAGFSFDPALLLAAAGALALIVFTGYLIIYNIFQISVVKDIRFYGLLKTVGATGKQLKSVIRRQALLLAALGIPAGLLLGFFLGRVLVPVLLQTTFNGMGAGQVQVRADPLIFVGSALFALVTVFLSTGKPGRLAASVSPVEAARYTGGGTKAKKEKRSTDGGRLPRMALSNLSRNRRRTVLAVLSMTLSLVLFNTVFTLAGGFDMDKFLSRFTDTDFLAAQAEYFNYQFRGPENELSETLIEAVRAQPGFAGGGRFFSNNRDFEYFTVEDEHLNDLNQGLDAKGNPLCAVYGLEDLPLSRLEVIEGELDLAKLATGDYILEGIQCDDQDQPYPESSHFKIGDTVTLHNNKGRTDQTPGEYTTRSFTLLAKVRIKTFTGSDGSSWDYNYYLPAAVYKGMVADPGLMSYAFNVTDGGDEAMEAFLKNYTETVEPTMHYSSKGTRVAEFENMQNTVLLIGGALSLIVGLVGVLNFINSVLTSIVTRRREFATLQAVGMTGPQLRRMLTLEGLYYALFAGAASLALSALASVIVVKGVVSGMWFFNYRFLLWPVLAAMPFLLILAVLVPRLALRFSAGESVVERLREEAA